VPFVLTTLAFGRDGAYRKDEKILIEPDPGGTERIEQLTQQAIAGIHDPTDDAYCRSLGHLRNIAVDKPSPVLQALQHLVGKVDGEHAEILRDRMSEVEWMKAICGED